MGKLKVAVLGGGIAGLTVAHELGERSQFFDVTLYEKSNSLGGKAKSRWTAEGFPAEHSVRTIHHVYYHLRDTLKRIPYENKAQTVFGNVRPTLAGSYKFFMLANHDPYILPHYFPWTKKGWTEYGLFAQVLKGMMPKAEIDEFLKKIFKLMQACYERRCNEFDDISWENYLAATGKSKEYYNCLLRLPEFYVAARGTARASSMGLLLARSIFFPLMHPFASQKSAADVFNGPSSDVFLDPWGEYIRSLKVKIKLNHTIEKINMDNHQRIQSISLKNDHNMSENINADIYVLALPIEVTQALTKTLSSVPTFKNMANLSVEPSSGIQFFISNEVDAYFLRGWTSFLDSPWAIIGLNQTPALWPNTHFKAPLKSILSLTWSNFDAPGVLYNKPAYACSDEEIKNEILAQVSLHRGAKKYMDKLAIHSWELDDCISFDKKHGNRLSHTAPLFVPYPGTRRFQPEAKTELNNVFLAGDYTQTGFDITTMEAANESGRRAVNAILTANQIKSKPCYVLEADQNGFALLKTLDRLIYKLQRKS